MRALWRAEDFPPGFAEQNASPLASRGFSSWFCGAKCEPSGEQKIFLFALLRHEKTQAYFIV
ncbi:hypothetical protein DXC51_21585 [Eisenbergiella massiliensis]|uniref:Uncharacterized protein n=1 Tax=Eisenbergiella massiliensis TaxID=1720294 RepID=A0A3E3HYP9_9FIRM|nr:hypothetical protein DXC51_21585 [Eisenbergiella massiliensis]